MIFAISALGAFVQRVFITMAPIVAADAGVSEAMGAVTLSIYLGAQGAGTITGGMLTDRVDRARLLAGLHGPCRAGPHAGNLASGGITFGSPLCCVLWIPQYGTPATHRCDGPGDGS